MTDRKRTALSLFSGAGGMDLGVQMAGFHVLASLELDPDCCETLRENILRSGRDTAVYEGDVRTFSPRQILMDLGYQPGEIDLLFGGPPCQAFSQIGKQQSLSDDRGMLLFQMVRYAEVIQPKMILLEQVKGLLTARDPSGRRGGVFDALLRELEQIGYEARWQVLLAADYGVPQLRERVFVVAVQGTNTFAFPEPTHGRAVDGLDLLPYRTVGEAIAGLGVPVLKTDSAAVPDDSHYDGTPPRDRERIHGVPEGKSLSSQTQLPQEQIGGLTRKDTTKFRRLDRGRPAKTLRGGEIFFHPPRTDTSHPGSTCGSTGSRTAMCCGGPFEGDPGR